MKSIVKSVDHLPTDIKNVWSNGRLDQLQKSPSYVCTEWPTFQVQCLIQHGKPPVAKVAYEMSMRQQEQGKRLVSWTNVRRTRSRRKMETSEEAHPLKGIVDHGTRNEATITTNDEIDREVATETAVLNVVTVTTIGIAGSEMVVKKEEEMLTAIEIRTGATQRAEMTSITHARRTRTKEETHL